MKINEIISEQIDWNALWKAGAVMPYLYKSKENPNPNATEPNIVTKWNLEKEKTRPGDILTPLKNMPNWQQYMDAWWRDSKNNPEAKPKLDQIRWSANKVGLPIKEWIAMPHTAKALGLRKANSHWMPINVGNNKGNEDAAGVGIVTKQNATKDVPVGGEYKNVKKLHLS